jgi:hypothetical protein
LRRSPSSSGAGVAKRCALLSVKPGFREALMAYLASSYDEIRDEDAS